MKTFSIVVPVHNEEFFLPLFLKSVCSQNLLPEELILIDDNSNDRTKKIMLDYQKKNNFIRVFSHKSSSEHMPGPKVVNAFLFGYSKLTKPCDFIFKLDADLVLLAMGFVGPITKDILFGNELKLDPRGNILANEQDYKTSVDKVFSAGDMRRGQSLVVWAIREGRQAAHSIDKYLMGKTILPR